MKKVHLVSDGPSAVDLAAIQAEWPLIEADLDALSAEISQIYAEDNDDLAAIQAEWSLIEAKLDALDAKDTGDLSELDKRRNRRIEARLTRAAVLLAARPAVGKAVA